MIQDVWNWLLDEQIRGALMILGSVVAAFATAAWVLYQHFSGHKSNTPTDPNVSADRNGMAAQSISAKADVGGTAIIATGNVNVYPYEQNDHIGVMEAIRSQEWERVDLKHTEKGFRALAIVPELPLQNPIQFNAEVDDYIENTKPDLVWVAVPERIKDGLIFKGEEDTTDGGLQEQRFSISANGVIHYSEIPLNFEGDRIRLDRIIQILNEMLPYAKRILNYFGYYGPIGIYFRMGQIQNKSLVTNVGTYLGRSRTPETCAVQYLSLKGNEVSQGNIIRLIIQEICRDAFGFNLDEETFEKNLRNI